MPSDNRWSTAHGYFLESGSFRRSDRLRVRMWPTPRCGWEYACARTARNCPSVLPTGVQTGKWDSIGLTAISIRKRLFLHFCHLPCSIVTDLNAEILQSLSDESALAVKVRLVDLARHVERL